MSLPLYRRLLGAAFDALPARVRELHDLGRLSVWEGRATVERGRSPVARIVAALSSLPPAGDDQPLRVTFAAVADREIWARQFGKALFRSVQYEAGGRLRERVATVTFVFATAASSDGLVLKLDGFRILAVPLPRLLHPAVRTLESEQEGRYCFEVEAHLPLVGLLVRYSGWLRPVVADAHRKMFHVKQ
jgi:Domain of unknown function (DUF4166)